MGAARVAYSRPTQADVEELVSQMRPDDRAECEACGLSVRQAVEESVANSCLAGAARINGRLVALYGVVPMAPRPCSLATLPLGLAWCLTTAVVAEFPVTFARQSRLILRAMLREVDVLGGFVDARYVKSIEWLRHLGVSVGPALAVQPTGASFRAFTVGGV